MATGYRVTLTNSEYHWLQILQHAWDAPPNELLAKGIAVYGWMADMEERGWTPVMFKWSRFHAHMAEHFFDPKGFEYDHRPVADVVFPLTAVAERNMKDLALEKDIPLREVIRHSISALAWITLPLLENHQHPRQPQWVFGYDLNNADYNEYRVRPRDITPLWQTSQPPMPFLPTTNERPERGVA